MLPSVSAQLLGRRLVCQRCQHYRRFSCAGLGNGFVYGLDPVIQYRRYIQVTDRFSLNTVGGK